MPTVGDLSGLGDHLPDEVAPSAGKDETEAFERAASGPGGSHGLGLSRENTPSPPGTPTPTGTPPRSGTPTPTGSLSPAGHAAPSRSSLSGIDFSKLSFDRESAPVIQRISGDIDLYAKLDRFESSLDSFAKGLDGEMPVDEEQTSRAIRVNESRAVVKSLERAGPTDSQPGHEGSGSNIFSLENNGQVGGLINVSDRADHLQIKDLVTDPSTSGFGKKLLEQAVNMSRHNGKTKVEATDYSAPFYKSQGFTQDHPEALDMTLDPGKSPKWKWDGSQWRLT